MKLSVMKFGTSNRPLTSLVLYPMRGLAHLFHTLTPPSVSTPKNGGIDSVDESRTSMLLGQMAGDVLSNAHHANDIVLLVVSGGGIEEYVKAHTSLGHERELKVGQR